MERPEDQSHPSVVVSFCAELYEESERLASEVKMESWSILHEGSGWNETTPRTREEAVAESKKLRFFYYPLTIRTKVWIFFLLLLFCRIGLSPKLNP